MDFFLVHLSRCTFHSIRTPIQATFSTCNRRRTEKSQIELIISLFWPKKKSVFICIQVTEPRTIRRRRWKNTHNFFYLVNWWRERRKRLRRRQRQRRRRRRQWWWKRRRIGWSETNTTHNIFVLNTRVRGVTSTKVYFKLFAVAVVKAAAQHTVYATACVCMRARFLLGFCAWWCAYVCHRHLLAVWMCAVRSVCVAWKPNDTKFSRSIVSDWHLPQCVYLCAPIHTEATTHTQLRSTLFLRLIRILINMRHSITDFLQLSPIECFFYWKYS